MSSPKKIPPCGSLNNTKDLSKKWKKYPVRILYFPHKKLCVRILRFRTLLLMCGNTLRIRTFASMCTLGNTVESAHLPLCADSTVRTELWFPKKNDFLQKSLSPTIFLQHNVKTPYIVLNMIEKHIYIQFGGFDRSFEDFGVVASYPRHPKQEVLQLPFLLLHLHMKVLVHPFFSKILRFGVGF